MALPVPPHGIIHVMLIQQTSREVIVSLSQIPFQSYSLPEDVRCTGVEFPGCLFNGDAVQFSPMGFQVSFDHTHMFVRKQ